VLCRIRDIGIKILLGQLRQFWEESFEDISIPIVMEDNAFVHNLVSSQLPLARSHVVSLSRKALNLGLINQLLSCRPSHHTLMPLYNFQAAELVTCISEELPII
jgi:hypothetical protein